jgi:hypothetical protein
MTKSKLLVLAKESRSKPSYSLDTLFKDIQFSPLRRSSYHPDINLMEVIWNMSNRTARERNRSYLSLFEVNIAFDVCSKITKNYWATAIEHVRKTAETYWKRECIMEQRIVQTLNRVGVDSSDETSDEE